MILFEECSAMFNRLVSFKLLEGHRDSVKTVTFSPDGRFLASSGNDKTILVWDWQKNQKFSLQRRVDNPFDKVNKDINSLFDNNLSQMFKPSDPFQDLEKMFQKLDGIIQPSSEKRINSVAFSPSRMLIASGGDDKTVKLWSLSDQKEIASWTGHSDKVYSVAFHPKGEILASGSDDKNIKLWSVKTGEVISTLQGHKDKVLSVKFSSDGKILASGGGENDKTIVLWNIAEKRSMTLKGHSDWFGGVLSVDISAKNNFIASASKDKTIKIWQIQDGKEIFTLSEHTDHVNSVSISPNNPLLASGSDDKTLKLWDLKKREVMISIPHPGKVYSVNFSPDGRHIATGCEDKMVRIYSTSELQELGS